MKINWNFSITLRWIRIPVLPIISLKEIEYVSMLEVKNPVPKRGSWASLPVPENADVANPSVEG